MNKAKANAIPVTAEAGINVAVVTATNQFQNWLASIDDTKFTVNSIHLQSVDMFGPTKVGFIKLKCDATDTKGNRVPGIVFMRGGSVAMLVVINKKYVVMTVQPRIPTGNFEFTETPAGMLDGSGNFAGVAAKEIEEELDLKIEASALVDLNAVAGITGGIFLSPGAVDETMHFYCTELTVSDDEMEAMNGKATGLIEEGEQISLKIILLEDLWKIADAKTIVAYTLYKKLQEQTVTVTV